MSDRFDPDAWPYPEDNEPQGAGNRQTKDRDNQDDSYQSLDFDKPAAPAGQQDNFTDPYSDAPYSDTGYDDYGYGNPNQGGGYDYGAPSAPPAYGQPSQGYGQPGDTYGAPDYGQPSQGYGAPTGGSQDDYDYGYAAPAQGSDPFASPPGNYSAPSSYDTDDDYGTIPSNSPVNDGGDREPYGSADEGYGYNDDYNNTSDSYSNSGSYDDDDPYGSQDPYGDDDYDDYDREPEQEGRNWAKTALGAAAVVILLLGGFFGFKALTGGDDQTASPPANQTTAAPNDDEGANDEGVDSSSSSTPATTPSSVPAGTVTASVQPAPAAVRTALDNALSAWGQFAVNGNLDLVKPYFAANGEQYKRLQADSESLKAAPPGGDPLKMTIANVETAKVDDNNWIVRGVVTISRAGTKDQTQKYEFRMVNSGGQWQVATIRNFQ